MRRSASPYLLGGVATTSDPVYCANCGDSISPGDEYLDFDGRTLCLRCDQEIDAAALEDASLDDFGGGDLSGHAL